MPGFLLEEGTTELTAGWSTIVYDPRRLARKFPNIDTDSGRAALVAGLVDTVWVSLLLAADDGNFYARHFTLQGPDLYTPNQE